MGKKRRRLKPRRRTAPEMIDLFAQFQRSCGWTDQTVKRRVRTISQFATFVAPVKLDRVKLEHLERFLGSKPHPATRHAYRSDLRVFYEWAYERDMIETNPTAKLHKVKVPRPLPRPLGLEVRTALETGGLRVRRMVGLGLYAGLRCMEIANLDCADLSMHTDPPMLTVRGGKGGVDRRVRMHPDLCELLAGVPSSGRVFTYGGHPIQPASVSRTIRRHFDRLGIVATPHQLRHTFGTEAARAARGNVVKVQRQMGHGSADTTMLYIGWDGSDAGFIDDMFAAWHALPGRPRDDGDSAA